MNEGAKPQPIECQTCPGCVIKPRIDALTARVDKKAKPDQGDVVEIKDISSQAQERPCPVVAQQRLIGPLYKRIIGRALLPLINSRPSRSSTVDLSLHPNGGRDGLADYRARFSRGLKPGVAR